MLPCCQRIPLGLEPHHIALDWALIRPKVRRASSTGRHHLESTVISQTAWVFSPSLLCGYSHVVVSSNVPVNLASLSRLESFNSHHLLFAIFSGNSKKKRGFLLTKNSPSQKPTLTTHTTHTSFCFWFRTRYPRKRERFGLQAAHPLTPYLILYLHTSKAKLHLPAFNNDRRLTRQVACASFRRKSSQLESVPLSSPPLQGTSQSLPPDGRHAGSRIASLHLTSRSPGRACYAVLPPLSARHRHFPPDYSHQMSPSFPVDRLGP